MVPDGGYVVSPGTASSSAAAAVALSAGGMIDETAIAYANVTSASLNPANDVLTLYDHGAATTVQLSGALQSASIGLSSDGAGGAEIIDLGVSSQVNDPLSSLSSTKRQTVILAGDRKS